MKIKLGRFLLGAQYNCNLLGGDRQDWQLDTVELVEATPCAGLCQALVDATQTTKIHLITATWGGREEKEV